MVLGLGSQMGGNWSTPTADIFHFVFCQVDGLLYATWMHERIQVCGQPSSSDPGSEPGGGISLSEPGWRTSVWWSIGPRGLR